MTGYEAVKVRPDPTSRQERMPVAPLVALFVGFLWFPLDLAAACFCVDNRRESCGEWPAAFWLTAEALFVIGVCTALPMA